MNQLFCFGFGYCAVALARRLAVEGWRIAGTSRSAEGTAAIAAQGYDAYRFDGEERLPAAALDGVSHLLMSVPPDSRGDPVLRVHAADIAKRRRQFAWAGYLSTTGVYGDRQGRWIDEESPLDPDTERGRRRVAAETSWRELDLPLHVFRLAGIYGPGRNQLLAILDGSARRIVKPGQVFGRIHVEDVAGVLAASIARPTPGEVYNVCDDEPCPPQEVVEFAARLMGKPVPPEVDFADAMLSPMAASFYAGSKRIRNLKMKETLGYQLLYPSYREGLTALAAGAPGGERADI